ncbi:MAG: cell wall-active antibiotics response protein [Acidimicrobiia bacterium]|nr:cell wall-active antibiotics response protein [Acidimicrobiia bacterium]
MTDDPITTTDPITLDVEPRGPSPGQIGLGIVLLGVGVMWLLVVLDILDDVAWTAVLAGAVIAIGVLLVVLARSGPHGGLIATGFAITLLLALALTVQDIVDVPFSGGIGDADYGPAAVADLDSPYRLAIGDLTVDLRGVDFEPGLTEIEATVAIGHLVVQLPEGVAVAVDMSVGAGQAVVDTDTGAEQSFDGLDVDENYQDSGFQSAEVRVRIRAAVGLGQVEVRR